MLKSKKVNVSIFGLESGESIELEANKNRLSTFLHERKPFIIRGMNLGKCVTNWSKPDSFLSSFDDFNPTVSVHVSTHLNMDFIRKNFIYKTLDMREMIKRMTSEKQEHFFISDSEKYYFRCIGENPKKDKADFFHQFPNLREHFNLPSLNELITDENIFSSILRMSSSSLRIWTHYDITDNILCHIVGRKKVVLFPPSDVPYLYLNGDKSMITDIENPDFSQFPKFSNVTWYECLLEPGDTLFIPALWFHNIESLDFSISINVFFLNLPKENYQSGDLYGNKDLVSGEKALQFTKKAINSLKNLPVEYKNFYLLRIEEMIANSFTNA